MSFLSRLIVPKKGLSNTFLFPHRFSSSLTSSSSPSLFVPSQRFSSDVHPLLSRARELEKQGNKLFESNQLDAAENSLFSCIRALKASRMPDAPLQSRTYATLGSVFLAKHKPEQAKEYFDLFVQSTGSLEPSLDLGISFNQLANYHIYEDKFTEAANTTKKAIEIFEKVDSSKLYLASSLVNLGALLHMSGDIKGAEESSKRALEIFVTLLGRDHDYTKRALTNLSKIVQSNGEEAVSKLKEWWTKQCQEEEKTIEQRAQASFSKTHLQQMEDIWKNWTYKRIDLRGMIVPKNISTEEKSKFDSFYKQRTQKS